MLLFFYDPVNQTLDNSVAALVNLQCAATTMYKVDCYAQNIVITAALVNLQWARLPVAIYSTCTPDDGCDCHPKHVE